MNFLTLEYFIIIAEEKSFTRAAKQLFTSQQSLSEHIKKLEAELGITLFKRGSRVLALTDAGECFYRGARAILSSRDQMLSEINTLVEKSQNQLTIAVATFDTPPFLSNLLTEFSKRYPQYHVTIVKRMVRDVDTHMDDVNLYFSFPPLSDKLEHCFLQNDCMAAAVHSSLPQELYGSSWTDIEQRLLKTQDLSLLSQLPFILLYDKNGYLSQDLEHIFNQYGMTPSVGFQSENADLNFSMCLAASGVFLAPMNIIKRKLQLYSREMTDPVLLYPIDSRGLTIAQVISYKKGKTLTTIEKRFIELTQEYLIRTHI